MRFFYDVAAPAEAVSMPSMGDIAALMAKQGVKVDGGEDSPATAAPEAAATPAEQASPAPQPEQKPESTPAPAAPVAAPPAPEPAKPEAKVTAPVTDWRETIKKQPETEVLKSLGFDDKMVGFIQNWRAGGDLKNYLQALSTDYSNMPAADVMRHHLAVEYPDITGEDFEEFYRMKVTEAFKLDPEAYTEQEVRRGNILLNAEARKARQTLIEKQNEFLLVKAPEQKTAEPDGAAERQRLTAEYRNLVETNPYTLEVIKNSAIAVGEGDDKFNYSTASPQKLLDILYDPAEFASRLYNEDGSPKVEKQLLIAAIVEDDATFLREYRNHCMMLGAKRIVEPIENASKPAPTTSGPVPPITNIAEALAKNGQIVSG